MDYFSDLINAVQTDLTIGNESTMYPLAAVKLAIVRAYRKAGGFYRWPETEDAKKTSSVVNQEYYDYPQNWRPDSAWKLSVDGTDYGDPLVFKDYLYEKENSFPSQLKLAWSSQWRRIFIYPTPTVDGNNNIVIWGQKIVDALVNDTDTTIFSFSMPECNDAIAIEATAILKAKGSDMSTEQFKSMEAKQILTVAWNKVRQDQTKYEKTTPMFEIPDFFPQRRIRDRNTIGNF